MLHNVILAFPNSPELYYSDENQQNEYLTNVFHDVNNGLAEIADVSTDDPAEMYRRLPHISRTNVIVQIRIEEGEEVNDNDLFVKAAEFMQFCTRLRIFASNNHYQIVEPYHFNEVFEVFEDED